MYSWMATLQPKSLEARVRVRLFRGRARARARVGVRHLAAEVVGDLVLDPVRVRVRVVVVVAALVRVRGRVAVSSWIRSTST